MFVKLSREEQRDRMVAGEIVSRVYHETMQKLAEAEDFTLETEEDILKYAEERIEELTDVALSNMFIDSEQEKIASEVDEMDEETADYYGSEIAYGQGLAEGEYFGKQAAAAEIAGSVNEYLLGVVEEVLGKEAAEAVLEKIAEDGEDVEEMSEAAAQEAADRMVEEIGVENVESDEDLMEQVDAAAAQVGEQVASEAASKTAAFKVRWGGKGPIRRLKSVSWRAKNRELEAAKKAIGGYAQKAIQGIRSGASAAGLGIRSGVSAAGRGIRSGASATGRFATNVAGGDAALRRKARLPREIANRTKGLGAPGSWVHSLAKKRYSNVTRPVRQARKNLAIYGGGAAGIGGGIGAATYKKK
jgi:hypothetical protein